MFSNFFIQRPVFSIVAAFIVLLLGVVSIPTLPIAQYPEITPPQVTVTANYTGASAEVVESTVTNVLEREINGVRGMRYVSSSSSNSGTSSINVTFAPNLNSGDARIGQRGNCYLPGVDGGICPRGVLSRHYRGAVSAICFDDRVFDRRFYLPGANFDSSPICLIAKAAIEASEERLRPILMTAISTLVGIFPLAIATGAGAGSRQSLGTAVFGAMLIATFLSLFVVPVLYVVVVSLSERILGRFQQHQSDSQPK
jgi:multidrug efflux pump subunit AcrB